MTDGGSTGEEETVYDFRERRELLLEDTARYIGELENRKQELEIGGAGRIENDERFQRALKRLERDIEDLLEEYGEVGPDYVESLESSISRFRELQVRYEELTGEQIEVIEGLEEELEELRADYERALERNRGRVSEHVNNLEELSSLKKRSAAGRALGGAGAVGAGLLSAELYEPARGVVDFYANAPPIYVQDPEMMLPTLILPLFGLYLLKTAYDRSKESQEDGHRAEVIRKRKP